MIHLTTSPEIQKQIEIVKQVNAEARESKESAIKFLTDAGILKPEVNSTQVKKEKRQ